MEITFVEYPQVHDFIKEESGLIIKALMAREKH